MVKERTGLSRSSNYLWISKGKFPAPVSLGARAVGWLESEIEEWVAQRIMESRHKRNWHVEQPSDTLIEHLLVILKYSLGRLAERPSSCNASGVGTTRNLPAEFQV
jgi:prophage regulatory protein